MPNPTNGDKIRHLIRIGETARKLSPRQRTLLHRAAGHGRARIQKGEEASATALQRRGLLVRDGPMVAATEAGREVARKLP